MVYFKRSMEFRLHYGASTEMIELSKELRRNMTAAEKVLWKHLRNRTLFHDKFRRQHAIGNYIADFFCLDKGLVIEVDGSIHELEDVREKDLNRTAEMERLGLKVIRFTNQEVMNDLDSVIKKILNEISSSISPSP